MRFINIKKAHLMSDESFNQLAHPYCSRLDIMSLFFVAVLRAHGFELVMKSSGPKKQI